VNGPRTTVITVTYRSRGTIARALDLLREAQLAGDVECVVVDNASDDGSADFVRARYPWVRLVESPVNLGFARGCNRGLEEARTPYVLFLNPDAAIDRRNLARLVAFLDAHPRAGLVSSAIQNDDGSFQAVRPLPTPWRILASQLGRWLAPKHERVPVGTRPFRSQWLCGAVLMARREVLEELGGFDPRFFLYFEETDLCVRAQRAGAELWLVGDALAHHSRGESARSSDEILHSGDVAYHFFQSRQYYLTKHYGRPVAIATELGEIVLLGLRAMAQLVRGKRPALFERLHAPVLQLPPPADSSGALVSSKGALPARPKLGPAVVLTTGAATQVRHSVLDINALTLTRSLGRRGVPAFRFHSSRSYIDLESRYCTHVVTPREPSALAQALVDFAKTQPERPVLFPAGDHDVEFIARFREVLDPHFAVCAASRECIETILDKEHLYQRARAAGVATPETHAPESLDEVEALAPQLSYPVALKPRSSHHWKTEAVVRAIGSVKAIRAEDAEALVSAYRRVAPHAPDVMVQEVVPGDDALLFTFLGYLGQTGEPLAACVRKKLRQSPPGFGYCCLTETVADDEVLDASLRLLRALDYRGIVSVEFKRDPRDGVLKLIEINPRTVRTTGAAVGAGVDLPWIAYQDLAGLSPSPQLEWNTGVRWIHLRDDFLAARELVKRGELTWREWLGVFRGRMVFADWAWDDPWPFVLAWRPVVANALRRRRKV
jgi:predicted ATP-grasp superfamily ATP-dependent carboligase/GT2 family glycosyltransferase